MEKISPTDSVRNEEVLCRVKGKRDIRHTLKRRKGNCIRKHIVDEKIERRIERTEIRGRRRNEILEIEKGSIILHSVENSLWTRLWTCGKRDYRMNEYMKYISSLLPFFQSLKLTARPTFFFLQFLTTLLLVNERQTSILVIPHFFEALMPEQ